MPLKHLGNGKIVALHITEQLQTEKLTLSLYYILFTLLYFLSRIFGLYRAVSLSLGHTWSFSRSVALSWTHNLHFIFNLSVLYWHDKTIHLYCQSNCSWVAYK